MLILWNKTTQQIKNRGDNIEKNTTTIHNTNHVNLHRMFKRRNNADEHKRKCKRGESGQV